MILHSSSGESQLVDMIITGQYHFKDGGVHVVKAKQNFTLVLASRTMQLHSSARRFQQTPGAHRDFEDKYVVVQAGLCPQCHNGASRPGSWPMAPPWLPQMHVAE